MKELAQAVTQKAQASLGAAGFFFEQLDLSKKFSVDTITADSFSQLVTVPTQFPVIFVDGGNNTLIDSPNMHVAALKVALVKQTNDLRSPPKFSVETIEASVIITLEKINDKKKYVVDLKSNSTSVTFPLFAPIEMDDPIIASTEENRVMMTLCNHVRQMLEWHYAKEHIATVTSPTLLILDGSFSPRNEMQTNALLDLLELSARKQVLVVAVAKTTSLTTTGGYAIGPFLMSHSPHQGMWATQALAESTTSIPFTMHS